jgi:hypothetical protein
VSEPRKLTRILPTQRLQARVPNALPDSIYDSTSNKHNNGPLIRTCRTFAQPPIHNYVIEFTISNFTWAPLQSRADDIIMLPHMAISKLNLSICPRMTVLAFQ